MELCWWKYDIKKCLCQIYSNQKCYNSKRCCTREWKSHARSHIIILTWCIDNWWMSKMQLSSDGFSHSSSSDSKFQSELPTNNSVQVFNRIRFPWNFRYSTIHFHTENQPRLFKAFLNWRYGSTFNNNCGSCCFGHWLISWGLDIIGNFRLKNSHYWWRFE